MNKLGDYQRKMIENAKRLEGNIWGVLEDNIREKRILLKDSVISELNNFLPTQMYKMKPPLVMKDGIVCDIPRLLKGDPDERIEAIKFINKAEINDYLPELMLLCYDEDDNVRKAAQKSLDELVIKIINAHSNFFASLIAFSTMKKKSPMKWFYKLDEGSRKRITEKIRELCMSEDPTQRDRAADLILHLELKELLPELALMRELKLVDWSFWSDVPGPVKEAWDKFVGKDVKEWFDESDKQAKQRFIEILRDSIESDEKDRRYVSAKLIGHLKLRELLFELVPLCFDVDIDVREEAQKSLRKLLYSNNIKEWFNNTDEKTRKRIIEIIKKNARSDSLWKRYSAGGLIIYLELKELFPELVGLCYDKEVEVREEAQKSLRKLLYSNNIKEWFNSTDEKTRKEVVNVLRKNITYYDTEDRIFTVELIGSLKIRELSYELETLSYDNYGGVGEMAKNFLNKL